MAFIPLNCPNCNGRIEYKEGEILKCPYCETELLLKQNHVYYVDQTINHYHGTPQNSTEAERLCKAAADINAAPNWGHRYLFLLQRQLHSSPSRSQSACAKDA